MPGFLGGSSSGSGSTGGEITFPKEFIDPVTKFRVSQPENLIDTDFEYGLQPTKWETVELINNTPSFFSKGGDTSIDGIESVTTNNGTREITVTTGLDHGLAVGIPISVTGTKSVTADGAYIINSIPNSTTFTYLCKDNQVGDNSIEDLYTSIITGEFFQGSQIRIANAEGIITDGEPISVLTVRTESTHGFGVNTPFYFLNLNSTISQEFEAANTAAKSFDSSNSATAQVFDGSNTLSSTNIDWSNSATVGGVVSNVSTVNTAEDTITVSHTTEAFNNLTLGAPLYYNVVASTGFFASNPRGVVFLKSTSGLGISTSTFQVSVIPDGDPIDIESGLTGTFQIANQARTFSGNNVNPVTEIELQVEIGSEFAFDGGNQGFVGETISQTNGLATVLGFTVDNILVSTTAGAGLDYYVGAMVRYSTTGAAATGLTNNTTYFIAAFSPGSGDLYNIRLKALPTDTAFLSPSGGTGTQTFTKIGVSLDKDIVHIKDSNFTVNDMLEYTFPTDGNFGADFEKTFYFVERAYDAHNYKLFEKLFVPVNATGGTVTESYQEGRYWKIHAFTAVGSGTFNVTSTGSESLIEVLVVAGGGGGGGAYGAAGGGGAGGLVYHGSKSVAVSSYSVVVGSGGAGGVVQSGGPDTADSAKQGKPGTNSSFDDIVALGGGGGNMAFYFPSQAIWLNGGSGGGGGDYYTNNAWRGGLATQTNSGGGLGYGFPGGSRGPGGPTPSEDGAHGQPHEGAGGGGAGGTSTGGNSGTPSNGGIGRQYYQFAPYGSPVGWFAGGGGGGQHYQNLNYVTNTNTGGFFGGGGRGANEFAVNNGVGSTGSVAGVNNTGGGGGGGARNYGGGVTGPAANGGSGVVLVRYPITAPPVGEFIVATGGTVSIVTVGGTVYAVHQFTSVGASTFNVLSLGTNSIANSVEYLVVGGGGGGGMDMGGGGGGGGVRSGTLTLSSTGSYLVSVGLGGRGAPRAGFGTQSQGIANHQYTTSATAGGSSSVFSITSNGGGRGGSSYWDYNPDFGVGGGGGSGGGASAYSNNGANANLGRQGAGTAGQGFAGGPGFGQYYGGGGGGAAGVGGSGRANGAAFGGPGVLNAILGSDYRWGGGGGGSGHSLTGGNGGIGGGGGGAIGTTTGGVGLNNGSPGGGGAINAGANTPGGNGGANTGGGGGGGSHYSANNNGGDGGSGIVVIRYPIGIVS